jgi:hypothetical protein
MLNHRCIAGIFITVIALALLSPCFMGSVKAQNSGTFPSNADGFNGMVITYSISGVTTTAPVDVSDFTTTRDFNFTITSSSVTVSGTFQMLKPSSGVYASATAEVDIGSQSKSASFNNSGTTGDSWSQPFTVTVPASTSANTGSISLSIGGEYGNGESRGLEVNGHLAVSPLAVDHIEVISPNDNIYTGDSSFYVSATVFGPGNTQVPDNTPVTFSLSDKEGGSLGNAYIQPETVYTSNSQVQVTFRPPDSSYWQDSLHTAYAGLNSITITASAGGKQGGYEILIYNPDTNTATPGVTDTTTPSSSSSGSKSPCIIFTATYGSPLAPQVVFMRSVRDDMIGSSATGKVLVSAWNAFYYSWSPPVAYTIAGSNGLKDTFKVGLTPLLGSMYVVAAVYHSLAWINPDFAAVVAFLEAAILSIGIYIALPLFALRYGFKAIQKHMKKSV